jgi:hypothetical protein
MPDKPPFVPNNATPRTVLLSSWDRAVVVATVLAYRRTMGEQDRATAADKAATAAFIAAGGDPAHAAEDVPQIIAAATQEHSDWFWRPARERLEQQERAWKARGIWPPPKGCYGGPGDD